MFPKKIRDWFDHQPPGGLTSIPASPHLLMLILRGLFIAITIGIATGALSYFISPPVPGDDGTMELRPWGVVPALIAFFVVLAVSLSVIAIDVWARDKQITTVSAVYFGLLGGFFLAKVLFLLFDPILEHFVYQRPEEIIHLLVTLITCYVSVSILVQTKGEFRFIIPYVEFSRQVKGPKPLVLDTSVIIDGRIADICETGIIDTQMIVPRFVLQELQGIADSSDKIKRNRGRRGLDVLKRMQNNTKIELHMHEANLAELRDVHKVDERLVVIAKVLGARVVTNDFNLNKISQLQGVEVINLNELANSLKLVALPGEVLYVRIVKQGDQLGQGVGYLDDGTMVVVEQGKNFIGQEVNITVTSVLQTPAGRMIFGKIEGRT